MSTSKTPQYYLLPDGRDILDITLPMTNACGNVIKYFKRAGLKQGEPILKDLKKALDYLEREIKRNCFFNACMGIKDFDTLAYKIIGDGVDRKITGYKWTYLHAATKHVLMADNSGHEEQRLTNLVTAHGYLYLLINSLETQNE